MSRSELAAEPTGRWRQLTILAVGILLAEAPWFTSGAVAPSLRVEWAADGVELSLLVVAVQLGFAAGAIGLAIVGAPDVIRGRWLFAAGAAVAAAANLGFAVWATDVWQALPFRALTGAAIAACYPVAMNMAAGWFRGQRGLALGVLIGALTAGVAVPYLLGALGLSAGLAWRPVVALASGAALVGAVIVAVGARSGPFEVPAPRFSPAVAAAAFRETGVRLANLGYLGHM